VRTDTSGQPIQVGRYVGAPTIINLSTSSNNATLKPFTHYRLWSSVDCFFQFAAGAATASTSSHPLKAGIDTLHYVNSTETSLAAIVATGTGVLYVSELDTQGF
jgi:hypothetical protein